jgi:hypothetical protein
MTTPPTKRTGWDEDCLLSCQKLSRQLTAGYVTFVEYASNVTLIMISLSEERLEEAVELISLDVLTPYSDYLRETLEPIDYMPSPMPFMAGPRTDEDIKRKKEQLRPKYIKLHQIVKNRVARVASARPDSPPSCGKVS